MKSINKSSLQKRSLKVVSKILVSVFVSKFSSPSSSPNSRLQVRLCLPPSRPAAALRCCCAPLGDEQRIYGAPPAAPAVPADGVKTRNASGKQPAAQVDLIEGAPPPQRPHHQLFDDATAAAFTARRVIAVFNFVKDWYEAVTDPEGRGCCMPFSHLGAMWPTLFKHGLDMTTEGDMKASSGFPRTHNGNIPSSDRALSGMLREKIKTVFRARNSYSERVMRVSPAPAHTLS